MKNHYPAKAIAFKAFLAKSIFNEPIRWFYIGSLALSQYGIKCFKSFYSTQGPDIDEVPIFECILQLTVFLGLIIVMVSIQRTLSYNRNNLET